MHRTYLCLACLREALEVLPVAHEVPLRGEGLLVGRAVVLEGGAGTHGDRGGVQGGDAKEFEDLFSHATYAQGSF